VLEAVLDGKELDFCLLLSSLASVLGGLGQAAYASANIYMDLFARNHNRSSSVPWLSVNWDVWRSQDSAVMETGLGATLKELGMNAEEATNMLETVLDLKDVSHLVVSTGDLGGRINQWIKLESLDHGKPEIVASPNRPTFLNADKTEQRIARIWEDALGIDGIGIHDSFAELGGHSLVAIRVVAELRKAFQIDLPIRVLFDAPTIAKLGSHIKKCMIAKVEALTEEEVQHLLRMSEVAESEDEFVADRTVASTL
jgi:acyl carrier protein